MSQSIPTRKALMTSLRRKVERLEVGRPPEDDQPVSTGSGALDRLLPTGGLRRGMLVEYLKLTSGCGAGTLALAAACEACRDGGALVVVEETLTRSGSEGRRAGHFYPPAAAAWGINLSAILVLRPASKAD